MNHASIALACALAVVGCSTVDQSAIQRAQAIAVAACGVAPSAAELAKIWGADTVTVDKASLTGELFCAAYLKVIASPDAPKAAP